MKDELRIRTLTERFFQGETTLEEEYELYRLFANGQPLPPDMEQLRPMMNDMAALSLVKAPQKRTTAAKHIRMLPLAIAASVALAVGIFVSLQKNATQQPTDEYLTIVYGERHTDAATAKAEMQMAMHAIEPVSVENQLEELFK